MSRRHTLVEARGRPKAPPPPAVAAAPDGLDRRQALAWLSSGAALAMAGCGKPREEILPYVVTPEGVLAGAPQRYATTLPFAGYGRGALVTAWDGRPTKIAGSPQHPASQGASDIFLEAEALSLYDPGRLRTVETGNAPAAWSAFQSALLPRIALARSKAGAGLTVLTGRITSPTELRLIGELQRALPHMAWRRFEPVDDDAAREGARMAFGRPLEVRADLARAQVVLCLDADPLGPGPEQIANGRAFAAARDLHGGSYARWYIAEPGWSLTGANADHRVAMRPDAVGVFAARVAQAFGGPAAPHLPEGATRIADAVAADLKAHAGRAVVLVGRTQPPAVHALAHWLNARLSAPVSVAPPVDSHPDAHAASLQGFAEDVRAGRVETLIAVGVDPLYAAPHLGLDAAWRRIDFSAALLASPNATGAASRWRLPLSHPLESWGDLRGPDGTASLVQPLIRPLYDSRTFSEVLAMLALDLHAKAYDQVRATWSAISGAGAPAPGPAGPAAVRDMPAGQPAAPPADQAWKLALTRGVLPGAPAGGPPPAPAAPPAIAPAAETGGAVLSLTPDPTVWDGRYAENAWLQECPKPMTHEVWGASVAVSPADAARWGLKDGERARLSTAFGRVEAGVRVSPGQAQGVVSGHLGGGREHAGPIGTHVGFALNRLAGPDAFRPPAVTVEAVGAGEVPPRFSVTHRIEGEAAKLSPELILGALPNLKPLDPDLTPPTLLPPPDAYSPAWSLVIDAAACIGCSACVVACQSENNIPVVGPHEVARGRDMHWLRIDTYDVGPEHEARPAFQPVPCMQCEHAPCEPVCPVEASVHDHEGLNGQVYNRCIGTRFCESNCPYQVRRFNFHGYGVDETYADMGAESYRAQKNPEVTIRSRGVMEKCTYCVQRISYARRQAEKEDRQIRYGEVTTACQDACPTHAIRFDDLTREGSVTKAARGEPRHYALLGELGTRPRTTYLARVRNPNPALAGAPERPAPGGHAPEAEGA